MFYIANNLFIIERENKKNKKRRKERWRVLQ